MKSRIKNIFDRVEEELDGIFIYNSTKPHVDMTFFYVTGLVVGEYEGCGALLYPDHSGELMISALEAESAKKADMPIDSIRKREEREEWIEEKLGDMDKVGVNASELTYSGYKKIKEATDAEIVDVSDEIAEARNVKDSKEIERIRKACDIASEVAEEIVEYIEPGIKEYELAAELSYMMKKKGATGDAFDIISSSGPNTAEPHYTAGDRKVQEGEFVLFDFGALYKRYVSDITRTYVVGEIEEKQRKIYETVREAQEAALGMIEAGVKGEDVHNAAAEVINSTEFKGKFTHGLGHSIGLSVHDGSGLSPSVDITLEPGMVFTVEPGIYLPGYGGVRIEDNVVVKEDGYDLLTSADRELKIV
ncbi:MAG: aminopeptidase P family protein [Candidatus Saliniplasma sp.]